MADVATQNAPQTPTKKTPKKTPKKATQKVQEVQPDEVEDSQEQLDDSQMTNGAAEHAEDAADDAQEQGEDVEDEAEQTAEGAGEDAGDEGDEPQSIAEGAQSQAEEAGEQAEEETDEAKGKVEETGEEAQEQGEEAAEQAQAAGEEAQDKAEGATEEAPEAAQDQTEAAHDQADEAAEGAQDKAAEAGEAAEGAHEEAEGTAEDAKDQVEGAADEAQGEDGGDVVPIGKVDDDGKSVVTDAGQLVGSVAGDTEVPAGSVVDQEGDIMDSEGNVIGSAEPNAEGAHEDAENAAEGAEDQAEGAVDGAQETAEGAKDEAEGAAEELKPDFEGALAADEDGAVKDEAGNVIANLAPEEQEKLGGQEIADIDNEGNLKNEDGEVVAQAELAEGVKKVKPEFEGALSVTKQGVIKDESGKTIANLDKEQLKQLGKQKIHDIDADGNCLAEDGTVLATCEIAPQEELDYSILNGCKVNKLGNVVSSEGTVVGKLVEGDAKKLAGKECDEEGRIWGDKGKQIGQAEPLPEAERAANETKPFEDFPDAVVEHSGDVTFEGRVVGKLVEGDKKQCEGKKVDPDGDVADKNGNTIGHAERLEDEPEQAPEEIDYSILVGHVVNKAGNVVKEDDGTPLGKVVEGELKYLIGKKVFKEGKIYNDGGDVIGRAEPIPENERITPKESPFEDFQPAVVQKNGDVMFQKDQKVGEVVEGDPKKLAGKEVDPEGDIVDKSGSVIGRAERWEEPEEEEAAPIDMSILAGKRVNKQGYVADPKSGDLYGKVVEGDVKKLQGKMCDKEGNIWDEGGNKVGRAELIPESERSGSKQGPFSDFQPCTVQKDGTVVDKAQNVVGRVKEGDAKQLFGKQVDEDGDINDSNGNKIGAAERWEPEEKEADKHPAAGLKVNREGNVVDQNGDVIAKLTEGEIPQCRGKEIDNDGDVVDQKGKSVGHVTLLEDIKPDEEPQGPSEEELAAQKAQQEKDDEEAASKKKDRDLAKRLGYEVDQTLERIKPVLDEMMEYIDEANAKPKEEVDEQKLVDNVKPLIHKGSDILNECNKNIRGMDPDGRIQSKAKQNAGSEEATPEENHLAEGLKTLTGSVTDSIEKAKKKVNGLPHAKKELNPLWGLLSEPLFQILAAVGLLLSGVLGLVGKLLGGLGLGGIVDGLLGGLGLNKLTEGLGLGKLAGGGK